MVKIDQIKWLQSIGVSYYLSEANINKNFSDESLIYDTNNFDKSYKKIKKDQLLFSNNLANAAKNLEDLRKSIENFEGCIIKELSNSTVFSDGNPLSKIMLLGEAPGVNEDKLGIPFCGQSGKLLDNMFASIGISRKENAYISNVVFWRPPANRAPSTQEIELCRPFVEKHIYFIKPKLIITVGSVAATSLLGKHPGISKIRQKHYYYTNQYLDNPISLVAIFHPAYLLRQPLKKRETWYDLLKIQQFIKKVL